MSSAKYSRRNLEFLLNEVFDINLLNQFPYFRGSNTETLALVLDTAEDIAIKRMRPYFQESDRIAATLKEEQVLVHPEIKNYYKAYAEAGLLAASFDERFGGQQLPKSIQAAADFILGNAHNAFIMFTSLSTNASELLLTYSSPELINAFALKILNGDWTGTMCLTETQAGSSLSDIQTTAYPASDGNYRIKGQKIFISAGDQDFSENIIHLVLARIENSPKGTKGISLFAVPKKRIESDGTLFQNDVNSIGIYHKMGQRSTPAMHLEFGAEGDTHAYLIGEANKGLLYMFQMMNNARLGVGLAGTYIATAAYYSSLEYAMQRPQGRSLNTKNPNEEQTTIIHHADVRRLLLAQKAMIEGSLSLLFQCYQYIDLEKVSLDSEKENFHDLLELLTPVAKTYGAEMGILSTNLGLQVLGGYGYTEDFPLEQLARDVRIMSLYEGTTGIQAIALLGRQIPMHDARSFKEFKLQVNKTILKARGIAEIKTYAEKLFTELESLDHTTEYLLQIAASGDAELFLSDANLYLELFGLISVGWQWLLQALVAQQKLNENNSSQSDIIFYHSKIETMQYFFHYELIKSHALHIRLKDDTQITLFKEPEILI